MNYSKAKCPRCGKRFGLKAVQSFAKCQTPGMACTKCGWFRPDPISRQAEVECDCGKKMGTVSVQMPVAHDGKLYYAAEAVKDRFCPACSEKRGKAGLHDPENVLTRHEVLCSGGCGKVQGWMDFEEGEKLSEQPTIGNCFDCVPRMRELAVNRKALEEAAAVTSRKTE